MFSIDVRDMVQVNFRVEEEVKRRAELACKNMGMNMSTAINIFLVKMGNEQRIPFEIKMDVPNKKTLKAFKEAEQMKKDKKKYKRYDSFDETLKDM